MRPFKLLAAPLDGYSERAFRALCHKYGADMTFTEMTRIDSLAKGNQSSWRRIRVDPNVPTSVQLLLNNQESTKTFIQRWKDGGYFTHEFNFNLGCPSKHIVDRGLGCAYMKRIGALNAHLQLFRDAFPGTPLSIKSRLGMNAEEKSRSQYTFMIANTNADYYIVHARHGRQQSSEPADWKAFDSCAQVVADRGKTIYANGDVFSVEAIDSLRQQYPFLAGVMVGRMAVQNPALFGQYKQFLETSSYAPHTNDGDLTELRHDYDKFMQEYYTDADMILQPDGSKEHESVHYVQNFMRHFGKHIAGKGRVQMSLQNSAG